MSHMAELADVSAVREARNCRVLPTDTAKTASKFRLFCKEGTSELYRIYRL